MRNKLIPALTDGRHVTDDERKLLSLPPRLGGMGLIMPSEMADEEFEFSTAATVDLTNAIKEQLIELPPGLDQKSREAKAGIRKARRGKQNVVLEDLVSRMTPAEKRANEISRDTGASNWLTSLPIEGERFPPQQGRVLGRSPLTLHLAYLPSTLEVCLRRPLQCHACTLLQERWLRP